MELVAATTSCSEHNSAQGLVEPILPSGATLTEPGQDVSIERGGDILLGVSFPLVLLSCRVLDEIRVRLNSGARAGKPLIIQLEGVGVLAAMPALIAAFSSGVGMIVPGEFKFGHTS